MFKTRLISSLFLIPSVIFTIFIVPIQIYHIIIIVICIISCWEWSILSKIVSKIQKIYITIIYGMFLTSISVIYLLDKNFCVLQIKNIFFILNIFWIATLFLVFFYPKSVIFWKHSKIFILLYGVFIITSFFLGAIVLRQYNYPFNHFSGSWLLLFVIVPVCCLDSGSYIFGKLYGKTKMFPQVSPYKTWEGLVGGVCLATVIFSIMLFIVPSISINVSKLYMFICFFITMFFSVFGDLTESMFKRVACVKNSSNIIPGHGGILDRIDSLTSAMPIFTYLMLILH